MDGSAIAVIVLSLTQRVCMQLWRVPRYALKTAGTAAAPLLPTLCQALPSWFDRCPQAAVLYMAAEVVKIFGKDSTQHAVLGALWPPLAPCMLSIGMYLVGPPASALAVPGFALSLAGLPT